MDEVVDKIDIEEAKNLLHAICFCRREEAYDANK